VNHVLETDLGGDDMIHMGDRGREVKPRGREEEGRSVVVVVVD
jgi:hypothetical protein